MTHQLSVPHTNVYCPRLWKKARYGVSFLGPQADFSVRSVSTDSALVPHEGEVSNTNVTPKRTESEVVPHVGKSILAPASRLTPVTLPLALMRVNKPQVTFDLLNTKLADGLMCQLQLKL